MTNDQPKDPPPPEPTAWDRVGSILGDVAAAGKAMADRNLKLWATMSQHIRERPYTTDDWSNDAVLAMETAMSNMQDTWDLFMRAPERERVAAASPTAFLLISARYEDGEGKYLPPDPIWMRVPPSKIVGLPDSAKIELSGDDPEGIERLKERLHTKLGPAHQAYLLEVADVQNLRPGVYGGSVYVDKPDVCLIASLRVIVEGLDKR